VVRALQASRRLAGYSDISERGEAAD
jgi:hypothetical protein